MFDHYSTWMASLMSLRESQNHAPFILFEHMTRLREDDMRRGTWVGTCAYLCILVHITIHSRTYIRRMIGLKTVSFFAVHIVWLHTQFFATH